MISIIPLGQSNRDHQTTDKDRVPDQSLQNRRQVRERNEENRQSGLIRVLRQAAQQRFSVQNAASGSAVKRSHIRAAAEHRVQSRSRHNQNEQERLSENLQRRHHSSAPDTRKSASLPLKTPISNTN